MSETNEQESNEQEEKEQSSTESQATTDQTTTNETDNFDAESLEVSFGLPPGSLKDVKDQASALAAVRDLTDKTLVAGLGLPASAADDAEQKSEKGGKKPDAAKTKGTPVNEEIEALRAELSEVKGFIVEQTKMQKQQLVAEVDRRLDAEVDSWASPKYGVNGSRNYKQTKAYKALRDELVPRYLGGAQTAGVAIPTIEIVARRIRVHDDDTFTPTVTKKADEKEKPLGTPGARRDPSGKEPNNIHEALMRNAS